jgi:hypothetical protein
MKIMKLLKVEEWEQNHINSITLKLIFAATLATLAATGVAIALRSMNYPELLFAPWGIALVIGISVSFHKGVMAERARQAEGKK